MGGMGDGGGGGDGPAAALMAAASATLKGPSSSPSSGGRDMILTVLSPQPAANTHKGAPWTAALAVSWKVVASLPLAAAAFFLRCKACLEPGTAVEMDREHGHPPKPCSLRTTSRPETAGAALAGPP